MNRRVVVALAIVLLTGAAGCDAQPKQPAAAPATAAPQAQTSAGAAMSTAWIRFTTGDVTIVVRLADNPTSRDLVSKLPLTLTFEEFAGREKISYLPHRLATDGSPGSTPTNGTLIYYKPWGNLGFYYNAAGGHDDNLIPLGTVETGLDQLNQLEHGPVTVEAIR